MSPPPCNFHVVNCWSKAGVGTSIILAFGENPKTNGPSSARIALDLGATPAFGESVPASVVLLSHGHVDHIGAIFSHARAHTLSFHGSVPTYYVPKQILPLVEVAKEAMTTLNSAGDRDGGTLDMNLVGVEPGDEVVLLVRQGLKGKEIVVRVFATSHAGCPGVGYVISTRRRTQVLKEEYRSLSGNKIRELARSGVDLKEELVEESFDVAYTGDTTFEALERNAELWSRCHTVFCEATFLDATEKSRVLARDRGHMHMDDIAKLMKCAGENQRVVLIHVSSRYSAEQALDLLIDSLPNQFASRLEVAVQSLSGSAQLMNLTKRGLVTLSAYRERKAEAMSGKRENVIRKKAPARGDKVV